MIFKSNSCVHILQSCWLSYHGYVGHREHVKHVELAQVEVVGAELRRREQGECGHQVHLHIRLGSYAEITLLVIFLSYGNLGYFPLSMLP